MGRRKKEYGVCKICGCTGQLSFEHVPPKAAFNDGEYYYTAQLENMLKVKGSEPDDFSIVGKEYSKKKQGAIGFYSLCNSCNNNTGTWYANSFVNWIYQSMAILLKANKNPTLHYPTRIYPLRIIKQIITMFFSVQNEHFSLSYPDLVRFILNKEQKYISDKVKIFCYYNIEGSSRYIGNTVIGNFETQQSTLVAEIAFPPVGFVMTIGSHLTLDNRLVDISYFAKYKYNDWIDHYQKFATLPTYVPYMPGDYRTKNEILETMAKTFEK